MIKENKPRDIKERTFEFAVRVLKMSQTLPKNSVNNILLKQIIRSSTSIGANIEEAQGGHTKSDFTHSMNIAKKEARETLYWLRLVNELNPEIEKRLDLLLVENEELIKILTTIVKKSNPRNLS
ncbi:MAG: four helix bundle protein [Patescibacteria group bacterium]